MSKKYSKSKSSARRASGGKRKPANVASRKAGTAQAKKKKIALFKAYMGVKPEADQPVNLNRNPSETKHRR